MELVHRGPNDGTIGHGGNFTLNYREHDNKITLTGTMKSKTASGLIPRSFSKMLRV